jgi:hypothetical protein
MQTEKTLIWSRMHRTEHARICMHMWACARACVCVCVCVCLCVCVGLSVPLAPDIQQHDRHLHKQEHDPHAAVPRLIW